MYALSCTKFILSLFMTDLGPIKSKVICSHFEILMAAILKFECNAPIKMEERTLILNLRTSAFVPVYNFLCFRYYHDIIPSWRRWSFPDLVGDLEGKESV